MARERLTWQKDADTDKQASPPPQTPNAPRTTPADHPAAYQDPDADEYENGDTSSWAEDVHPGPYDTAAAPATPGYQEPADHPAAKPGKPMQASEQKRKETERKAAKCIRIAASMIGAPAEGVSEEKHTAAIENHALDLMDLPDENIHSMLQRLGMDDEDEDEDEGADKEASMSVTAARDIMASIEGLKAGLTRIAEAMGLEAGNLFAQPMDDMGDTDMGYDDMDDTDMSYDEPVVDEEETMLEEMLADAQDRSQNDPEYGYAADDMDEEEMLAMMLSGMGGEHYAADDNGDDDDDDDDKDDNGKGKVPPQFQKKDEEKENGNEDEDAEDDDEGGKEGGKKAGEEDIILAADADPMGLMDPSPTPDESELAKLYLTADDDAAAATEPKVAAGKKSEEEEEEAEVEVEEKEGGKKANLKPQPRKPSTGAQALGQVQKVASSEATDLSSLWEHAPDVSSVFS